MAFDEIIRNTLQRFATTVQKDLDTRLAEAAAELASAAEDYRLGAEAEAMSTLAAKVAAERAEADQRVATEAAKARDEAEQAVAVEVSTLRGEMQTARAEAEELRQAADRAREQLEATAAELERTRDRAAAAEQALNDLRQAEVNTQAGERQQQLAALDRLIAGVRRVGAGATLSDVLNALGDAIASETSRTAVLVASGESYQPLKLNGFTGVTPAPISRSAAASLTHGLPFAPLPPNRVGFTVAVEVGGQTVALAYADDCSGQEESVPSCWPEAIEVLARHAALRLETLTALRTVQALSAGRPGGAGAPIATIGTTASTTEDDQSARRYARLLVSEIKLYNEGAVRLGRQNRDLLERLRPEIERARRLYEERVPSHVPARATYFDDELVQTLADGDPGLLGARR